MARSNTADGARGDEIMELEREFWQAMKDGDVDTARRLTSFPCILAGPSGARTVDEATFVKLMQDGRYRIEAFELSDPQVRFVGDDVALVAYEVHEKVNADGKEKVLDAADASTWIRSNGRWACAAHSEAVIGN